MEVSGDNMSGVILSCDKIQENGTSMGISKNTEKQYSSWKTV